MARTQLHRYGKNTWASYLLSLRGNRTEFDSWRIEMRWIKILPLILMLTATAAAVAQTATTGALKEVKVYYYFIGKDGTDEKILPLKRMVSAGAPLFLAIAAIVEGP